MAHDVIDGVAGSDSFTVNTELYFKRVQLRHRGLFFVLEVWPEWKANRWARGEAIQPAPQNGAQQPFLCIPVKGTGAPATVAFRLRLRQWEPAPG